MTAKPQEKSVLFICLGNYCRSPMAEAVFKHCLEQRNLQDEWIVGSAGILGWNAGGTTDERVDRVLKDYNIEFDHTGRQLKSPDFRKYYWIFGMDHQNISDIKRQAPSDYTGKIELLGEFDPEKKLIIRDPYYDSGDEGFYECYSQCVRSIEGFLDKIYDTRK